MNDTNITALAQLLVRYSLDIQKGETVAIRGPTYSEPLVRELYAAILEAGGIPSLRLAFSGQPYTFYSRAQDHHLDACNEADYRDMAFFDAYMAIRTYDNARELSGIDPQLQARASRAQRRISDLQSQREETGAFRWSLAPFPTASMAQEAGMALEEYESFVYRACHLDKEDPVAEWKRISAEQERLCRWLSKRDEFRFVGPGTDLSMSCAGRTWINCDGHKNMPDGEVFTGPVEDSAQGTITFTYPALYRGTEVSGIRLTFKDGVVADFDASKGRDFLGAMIGTDEGSRRIGEIAIGTNYGITRFTRLILFDEKIGGTMHLALGDGITGSGSRNRSAIHWDMLKEMRDGGKIYADGELFYENGTVLI